MTSFTQIFRRMLPTTLARRHILILGVSFFAIQVVCLSWLLYYLLTVQINLNLNNKAYLFSDTYTFLATLTPEQRVSHIKRLTNARMHFHLSPEKPDIPESKGEDTKLFRLRILHTLASMYKGISFVYDKVPWTDYSPPEEQVFFWASDSFDDFQKNIPLLTSVYRRSTPFRILWGNKTPSRDDRIDLIGAAALPFSDGTWLVADIQDNEYTAADTTLFVLSFLAQFLVLMLVVTLEIKLLVRPIKKIQNDAAHINLDSPREFQVPEDTYEEIKSLACSIRELTLRLSEQIRQRSMTLTSLSHDLRSPICRMRMQMEKLEKYHIRETRILSQSLDELQELVDSVLSYARSGKVSEDAVLLSLPALLHSLEEDFQDAGHSVSLHKADACSLTLFPSSIKRCLQNLIQNALDYAKNNSECYLYENCEVQIEGECVKDGYVIRIRDYGEGMSEEDLERVFEPFVRLETSRNRTTGGTGLGLSIAQNLAHMNNAHITLSNAHPGLLATVFISR